MTEQGENLTPAESAAFQQAADEAFRLGQEKSGGLAGRVIDGKYKVLRKLGQGGMGAVYEAEHMLMQRHIALKVLHPNLAGNEDSLKRFFHEGRVASKLVHPSVVTIYDLGVSDGLPYIAMEYVEGRTLKTLLAEEAPLELPRILNILRQVGSALSEAHQLGIIHRDLKPDNIIIRREADGVERAYVLDFGIAKLVQGEEERMTAITRTGCFVGTPQYMSPEAAKGQLDARSDIYSLGIIAYEMIAGGVPFDAPSFMEVMIAHVNEAPLPVRRFKPELEVPQAVDDAVMKALAKDPAERYQTVNEMVFALKNAVELRSAGKSGVHAPGRARRPRATPKCLAAVAALSVVVFAAIIGLRAPSDPAENRAATGVLSVISTPDGAKVKVNEKNIGSTPLQLPELKPGRYSVEIRKQGFSPFSTTVRVDAGATVPVDATLVELDESKVPEELKAPAQIALPRPWKIESLPPGAEVVINGQPRGRTPLQVADLEAGEYVVSLKLGGFKPYQATVQLSPSSMPDISAALKKSAQAQPRAAELLRQAAEMSARNEFEEAVLLLEQAVALDPQVAARLSLGYGYLRTEKREAAREQFEAALAADPRHGPTYYAFAAYFAASGDRAGAVKLLQKSFRLAPELKQQAKGDEFFRPLRERPDFRKLLQGSEGS